MGPEKEQDPHEWSSECENLLWLYGNPGAWDPQLENQKGECRR